MTGELGLGGYFKEFDRDLSPEERLRFEMHEVPPAFDASVQPSVPQDEWNAERLEKANRNYALNYIRNGLSELVKSMDAGEARALARRAAGLIGLQYFQETAAMIGAADDGLEDCADYLAAMFQGMGDEVLIASHGNTIEIEHRGLRVIKGLPETEADLVFDCWSELWKGTARSQRIMKTLEVERDGAVAVWRLGLR